MINKKEKKNNSFESGENNAYKEKHLDIKGIIKKNNFMWKTILI